MKWLDKEKRENPEDPNAGQDWIVGASIVQCEINNAPIKVRNHTTPHMVYFGKMNKNSYSAILGKAHKVAKSEYGLRLAKRVLEQVKKVDPTKMISQQQVETIIASEDSIWDEAIADSEADVTEMLSVSFYSMLDEIGVTLANNAELVPDAEMLPEDDWQDNWLPDDLPGHLGTAQMNWWCHTKKKKKVHILPVRTCFCLVKSHLIVYSICRFHLY